jgi:hypothetical protein
MGHPFKLVSLSGLVLSDSASQQTTHHGSNMLYLETAEPDLLKAAKHENRQPRLCSLRESNAPQPDTCWG